MSLKMIFLNYAATNTEETCMRFAGSQIIITREPWFQYPLCIHPSEVCGCTASKPKTIDEVQNRPSQDGPLWCEDYFEWKATETL